MLPVTSAIQSDILQLYLRAVDVYINVIHLPYTQSIPVLAIVMFYTRTGELITLYIKQVGDVKPIDYASKYTY